MKRLLAWIMMICLLLSVSAAAEVGSELAVNEDLLAFKNELTGEVVRLGMTFEEVEAVAGKGYPLQIVGSSGAIAYEGGLLVGYMGTETGRIVGCITVVPVLLGDEYVRMEGSNMTKEDLPEKRAYSQYRKGYLDAVQNSTGTVLEQAEMDRAEIEAITGPALREQVIDDEFFFVNYSERKFDAGASGEPGRMILADYDGISVLYGIMGDGEVRSLIFTSGHWYRMANGFDMGDSAADIKALLGEYAVCSDEEFEKEYDFRYMRASLCRDAEGLRLITEEERKALLKENVENIYTIFFRVGGLGNVSRVQIMDMTNGLGLMSGIDYLED